MCTDEKLISCNFVADALSVIANMVFCCVAKIGSFFTDPSVRSVVKSTGSAQHFTRLSVEIPVVNMWLFRHFGKCVLDHENSVGLAFPITA